MAEGGSALRELVAWLGFEVDDAGLKKGEQSLKGIVETAKHMGEAIIAGFAIDRVGEWISSQVEAGASLEHTSQMLGIAVEDLENFRYAAQTVGIASDEADMALRFLNRTLGEAKQGNAEAAKAFAEMHVATKNADGSARDMTATLADVANWFQKTNDPALRTAQAMKIFGRQGAAMIPLLMKGGDGLEGLYQEFEQLGGGMGENFVKNAEEAEHAMVKFKAASGGLQHQIAGALLPVLTDVAGWASSMVSRFRELTSNTGFIKNALATLTVAAVAAAAVWAILNIEILAVVAAFALALLAIDDIVTFFQGGNSVIGKWIDDTFGPNSSSLVRAFFVDMKNEFSKIYDKVVNELIPAAEELWDALQSEDGKKSIHDFADAVSAASDAMHDISSTIKTIIDGLTAATNLAHDLRKAITPEADNNVDAMSGTQQTKNVGLNVADSAAKEAWEDAKAAIFPLLGAERAYTMFEGITNPSQGQGNGWGIDRVQNTISVDVHGVAGDAAQVGGAVANRVKDEIQDLLNATFATAPAGG